MENLKMNNYILMEAVSPLGDGKEFGRQIVAETMPEVLKYGGILIGILAVILIAKSFLGK
jgi:hypothetical protein